jgi:acyl carrier protein
VSADEVTELLRSRLAAVLATDAERIDSTARFDEDLQADSLDLVEVVEGVERDLASRGLEVASPDDELASLATVAEAAERIASSVRSVS